jgi:hypothetical protein
MPKMSDRPTAELIVIWLAGIVGTILIIRPEIDMGPVALSVSDTTNVVIGAVVGYIAGRNVKGDKSVDN